MRFSDHKTWHKFTYNLIYPAILGSMLFDVFNFNVHVDWVSLAKYCIVILYCIDYLHLFADLRSPDNSDSSGWHTLIDAAISISFGVTYWAVSGSFFAISVASFLFLTLIMLLYIPSQELLRKQCLAGQIILLILSGIFAYVCAKKDFIGGWYFAYFYIVFVIWYAIHVFIICECKINTNR